MEIASDRENKVNYSPLVAGKVINQKHYADEMCFMSSKVTYALKSGKSIKCMVQKIANIFIMYWAHSTPYSLFQSLHLTFILKEV